MKPIPTQSDQPDGFHIPSLVIKIDVDRSLRVVNYPDAIEHHLPQVAIDLRERFRSGIHTHRRNSPQHLSKN